MRRLKRDRLSHLAYGEVFPTARQRAIADRSLEARPSKRRLVWVAPGPAGKWQTIDSETGKAIRADYRSRAQAEHHARELMGGKH